MSASMGPLVALALATPVWGFALTPPMLTAPSILPDQVAQLGGMESIEAEVEARVLEAQRAEAFDATVMDWTVGLQVATTAALAVTGTLGFIQFSDEYGFHERWTQTACATGEAVLDDCGEETPWEHALAAGTSALLLTGTIVASAMVNYDTAVLRDGDWRVYEVTRWIALGLTGLQALGGFLLANAVDFGWADPQEDFQTLQGFAGAHLALGVTALGANVLNSILLF